MRRLLAGCLGLTLACAAGQAAEPDLPRPAPAVTLGAPVSLGPPVAAKPRTPIVRGQSSDDGFRVSSWAAALTESPGSDQLSLPPLSVPDPAPRPPFRTTSNSTEIVSPLQYAPPPPAAPAPRTHVSAPVSRAGTTSKSKFGEFFEGWFEKGEDGRACLESDHCFPTFVSPVTNPFIAEDPRALTEVRPIFFYQSIPSSNWIYRGGNAEFFGLQARLALTENWSVVINKLGWVSINPGGDSLAPSETGFSEFWIGPKWTFLRDADCGRAVATGVTFQIPTGDPKVFQDTGKLSVMPYITAAQNFGRTSYGSFNVMDTAGYNFRTDNTRSEYFVNSAHLDFDVLNLHRIFPLVELNWFYYTRSGKANAFAFEGADLVNYGSTDVNGRNNLNLATGLRYKFSEHFQAGAAVEFPLVGTRDINAFRMTFDLVFRF